MNVTLYAFSKKVNSTKRPVSTTPKLEFNNVELKAPSTVHGPSLLFSSLTAGDEVRYNYAYISNWSKYYFITEWTWENGLWRADLSEDVLATFKTDILSQNFYVLRSSSSYDGSINDNFYPVKNSIKHIYQDTTALWYTDMTSGFFVASIINSDPNAVGGVSFYAFTPAQYKAFQNYLLQNDSDWMNTTSITAAASELTEDLIKTLNNPYQYITSLTWYPFTLPALNATLVHEIPFGWWSLTLDGYRISLMATTKTATITIPKHPQAATRGSFLLYEPYSSYILHLPPFGSIPVSAAAIANEATINISVAIDFATGKALLTLSGTNYVILRTIAQLGVPIQVSAVSNRVDFQSLLVSYGAGAIASFSDAIVGAVNSVVTWAGNTFGFDAPEIPAELGKTISGIANGIMAQNVTASCAGSTGSVCDYLPLPAIQLTYSELVNEDLSENGRPLCQTRTLSGLSGFCMCQQPDPQLSNATSNETAVIAQILAGGFFIE